MCPWRCWTCSTSAAVTDPATDLSVAGSVASKTTLWRVLTGADPAAVNTAIGAWLLQVATGHATGERSVEHEPAGERTPDRLDDPDIYPGVGDSSLLGIAVDGKAVRVRHEVACGEWITSWRWPVVT